MTMVVNSTALSRHFQPQYFMLARGKPRQVRSLLSYHRLQQQRTLHEKSYVCQAQPNNWDPEFNNKDQDDEQGFIDVGSQVGDSIYEESQSNSPSFSATESGDEEVGSFMSEDQGKAGGSEFWEHVEPSLFGDEISRSVTPDVTKSDEKPQSSKSIGEFAFPPTFPEDQQDLVRQTQPNFEDSSVDELEEDEEDEEDEEEEEYQFSTEMESESDIYVDYGDSERSFRYKEQLSSMDETTVPIADQNMDWREFRARLIKQNQHQSTKEATKEDKIGVLDENTYWAHMLPVPEKGCVLVASPHMFRSSQQYFRLAVILILEHSDQATIGIILNRPRMHRISELEYRYGGMEMLMPEFGENKLMWGGDCGQEHNALFLLHPHGDIEGSEEIVQGVYAGGITHAKEMVQNGEVPASDFKFFLKYCGWRPGQLEEELNRRVWLCLSASPKLILRECENIDGQIMWHRFLRQLGGKFADMSRLVLTVQDMERQASQQEDQDESEKQERQNKSIFERDDIDDSNQ